jgi:hypothetical protein
MRIVSQDKEVDINYDNYMILYDEEYEGVGIRPVLDELSTITIGYYKSKERALQVMAEIREAAESWEWRDKPSNTGRYFYEMPKE